MSAVTRRGLTLALVLLAALLAVAALSRPPASASTPGTQLVHWDTHLAPGATLAPGTYYGTPSSDVEWPQNLDAQDGGVTGATPTCGAVIQADVETQGATLTALLAAQQLDLDSNGHPQDSSIVVSWSITVLPDCNTTPIPVAPVPTAPSCTAAGSLHIPANTDAKWLVNGDQVNAGAGGDLGPGTYSVTVHTAGGAPLFTDGSHSKDFGSIVVLPKLASSSAACAVAPPVKPVATVAVSCTNWSIVATGYNPAVDNSVVYSIDGGSDYTAHFGAGITLAGGPTNAWVAGAAEHSIKADIDGVKHAEATTDCVKTTPPPAKHTSNAPKPSASHSSSIGTALTVTKSTSKPATIAASPAASTTPLASTGSHTAPMLLAAGALLALGAGLTFAGRRRQGGRQH